MNRKLTIQSQLSRAEAGTPGTSSQRGQRLADLKNQLDEMRTKYTPDYPEIKRLENQIAELEKHPEKSSSGRVDPQVADLRNTAQQCKF
ncbi:MAG: hypothetical protein MZU79_00035 [Anaerotruncus sp.]|nr:hypothetical protein [Anaerotruncus sp.]